jgi:hypothetical protein
LGASLIDDPLDWTTKYQERNCCLLITCPTSRSCQPPLPAPPRRSPLHLDSLLPSR